MSQFNIGSNLILNTDITVGGGEVKTGATFNGKPVYFECKSGTVSSSANVATDIAQLGTSVDRIISVGGTIYGNNQVDRYPLNNFITSGDYSSCWTPVSNGKIVVRLQCANSNRLGASVCAWAYYTKTTD